MKKAGQVVLFRFPQTDLAHGKLRPALLLGQLPGPHADWLICMVTSQLQHFVSGFDEIVGQADADFALSGLKMPSLIRLGRLAVVDGGMLLGSIGQIDPARLERLKTNLVNWLNR